MKNHFTRLVPEDVSLPFDCGDEDLNHFLFNDAVPYQNHLLSVTYIGRTDKRIAYFFSLSNDKISAIDNSAAFWRKMKKLFPHSKHRKDYPAVKIGRLGVDLSFQRSPEHWGSLIIKMLKLWMIHDNKTGCRFITVDAYRHAIPFYLRNDFQFMGKEEELRYHTGKDTTIALYFDLYSIV